MTNRDPNKCACCGSIPSLRMSLPPLHGCWRFECLCGRSGPWSSDIGPDPKKHLEAWSGWNADQNRIAAAMEVTA